MNLEIYFYTLLLAFCFLFYIFFDKIKKIMFNEKEKKEIEIKPISKRKRIGSPRKTK
jgi:hypothetical protein